MKQITIFASGAGSNARELIRHFSGHPSAGVGLVVCNRPGAGVTAIAAAAGVPVLMIERQRFLEGDAYLPELGRAGTDLIVLAGFLWKLPPALVQAYRGAILNLHPALLPKFGGKGMYGARVHEAVIAAGERESGITIHEVDEQYDHGRTVFQARTEVAAADSPETLAGRIHALEHRHFPKVVEAFLNHKTGRGDGR